MPVEPLEQRLGDTLRDLHAVTVAFPLPMSTTTLIRVPEGGAKLVPGEPAPDNPIVPFIEGDGIGVDITPVMKAVVDAAVAKAFDGAREIRWTEIYAGEKSTRIYGPDVWLPELDPGAVRGYFDE